ncbi:unnamed protein product, partial [Owenia fusiformis]
TGMCELDRTTRLKMRETVHSFLLKQKTERIRQNFMMITTMITKHSVRLIFCAFLVVSLVQEATGDAHSSCRLYCQTNFDNNISALNYCVDVECPAMYRSRVNRFGKRLFLHKSEETLNMPVKISSLKTETPHGGITDSVIQNEQDADIVRELRKLIAQSLRKETLK